MAEPNSVWQQPTPVTARTIATQTFNPAEYTNPTNPTLLMVEQQWREANRLGLARNHGKSLNTDETDAAR